MDARLELSADANGMNVDTRGKLPACLSAVSSSTCSPDWLDDAMLSPVALRHADNLRHPLSKVKSGLTAIHLVGGKREACPYALLWKVKSKTR